MFFESTKMAPGKTENLEKENGQLLESEPKKQPKSASKKVKETPVTGASESPRKRSKTAEKDLEKEGKGEQVEILQTKEDKQEKKSGKVAMKVEKVRKKQIRKAVKDATENERESQNQQKNAKISRGPNSKQSAKIVQISDSETAQPQIKAPANQPDAAQNSEKHKKKPRKNTKTPTVNEEKTAPADVETSEGHRRRYIVFVGNLSFETTADRLRVHFSKCDIVDVRLRENKATGKSKGFAFIEVRDIEAYRRALALHHTPLDGRRINVEMTAGGGGNKSERRKQRLKDKNHMLHLMRKKTVETKQTLKSGKSMTS